MAFPIRSTSLSSGTSIENFKTENSIVQVLIPKTTFYAMMSERFVDETYHGSLPAFIAAFTSRKTLSAEELKQIRLLLDTFEEE